MTRNEAVAVLRLYELMAPGELKDRTKQAVEMAVAALTVDAVPVKHGRWIWSKRDGAYLCNVCNGGYKGQPTLMGKPMYEWCPMCGAKMDGGGA